jgi:hypothetical protein
MQKTAILSTALVILSVGATACSRPPGDDAAGAVSPFQATSYRVRSSVDAPLNQDVAWAAGAGEPTVVAVDEPFRIRFEVEAPKGTEQQLPTSFTLQARRNGGAWQTLQLRDFPYPDEISTPGVSLVRVDDWGAGEATTDLLAASSLPFFAGQGVCDPVSYDAEGDALESDNAAAPWPSLDDGASRPAGGIHGEWEWPVVIRLWADGAVTNSAGDTFDFQMLDGAGLPVHGAGPVRVTLRIPDGLVGGTYVETPGVLGPWQGSNGWLYFPMEPAETFNVLMVVVSKDNGRTWFEMDGANRPATDDLEGFDSAWRDGVIFFLHQISEATYLHAFDTGATGGGQWTIRDELVSEHSKPPTQVAALAALDDGSLVAVYGDASGLLSRVRNPDGSWQPESRVPVDNGLASGVMAVRAADDVVHVAYSVTSPDGNARSVWHRMFAAKGGFTEAARLGDGVATAEEDIGALLPLGWQAASNTVIAAWRRDDGTLWERRIRANGSSSEAVQITSRPVVQNGSDSDQVGADLVVVHDEVHVVFIDEATRDLWHTSSPAPGTWTQPRPVVEGINAQWVRGRVVRDDTGSRSYGLVYDAGSDGGSGMNRYVAISLEPEVP